MHGYTEQQQITLGEGGGMEGLLCSHYSVQQAWSG